MIFKIMRLSDLKPGDLFISRNYSQPYIFLYSKMVYYMGFNSEREHLKYYLLTPVGEIFIAANWYDISRLSA